MFKLSHQAAMLIYKLTVAEGVDVLAGGTDHHRQGKSNCAFLIKDTENF